MVSELPAGWVEAPLEECVDILDAQRQPINSEERTQRVKGKSTGELFPYYGATGQVGMIDGFLFDEELVALGEDGVPFFEGDKHKAYMLRGKTWVNNHAHVLRSIPEVLDNRILCHFLNQFDYRDYVNGGTRLKLTQANMRRIPLRIPPHAEQKRIAQKLDALLAQVDTLKARIDAIPALLKRFRQSVLSAALNGQLTIDFVERSCNSETLMTQLKEDHAAAGGHARGNASQPVEEAHDLTQEKIPGHWRVGELRDLCEPGRPITYGILKPGPELEVGIPYIRVADFPGNKLNPATIKNTSEEIDFAYRRARLKAGDLLLSIRGSVGRLIKIPAELEGANITQDTARLSISGRVSVDFVHLALRAEDTQRRMRAATRGVAVRGINIGDVRALQIPVPGMDEQAEIVRRVEQLFAYADQLEAKVTAAQQRIDALTQSLLAKAFRGELVPQDPSDEPASALLERIRAQRAAAPKPKRGRKAATS
ncbi:restriction endonuclease subunit S [uncultured Xanthomonas sp.]|uniref:restriction endonuclease subunit S n=1 Tax=Xanthomonas sacchari TaxID=56458 RepID=UPI0025E1CFDB|nr:restriction endonuclease subunit S [uncultured Xanthomonas sp.]